MQRVHSSAADAAEETEITIDEPRVRCRFSTRALAMGVGGVDSATSRFRLIVAISGGVYLAWWFMVELLLPGSFNPLPGRLLVVALDGMLLAASYGSRWVERRLSLLFTAWVCVLV